MQIPSTRRHFLAQSGLGLTALASLLDDDLAPTTAGCPACRTTPTAKRVIYLFQSGAPVADGPVRLQAAAGRPARHGAARLDPPGPAADRHDRRRRTAFPVAPSHVPASPSTARAAPGSASCCRTRRSVADELCFIKSMHTEAINHDPAITFFQTGAQLAGPAEHRLLARLRPGQREPRPARLRRPDLAGHRQPHRPAALRPPLGQRLPAVASTRASSSAPAATRCSTCRTPPASTPPTRRRHARRPGRAQPAAARRDRRPRDRHAHRPVRDGLPHADVACRS